MNNLDYRVIGKRIRDRRKALGVTQEQIAEYLDVKPSHISNIETGRAHPSLVIISKLNLSDRATKEKILQIVNILL